TGALHVDDQQRQLQGDGQRDRLALERDTRPGRGGHAERTTVRCAERHADRGDLLFGLDGGDTEALVLAQLVQHVGGGRDRVGAEEDGQLRPYARGNDAQGERGVAGDVAVVARHHVRRLDLVAEREVFGGLAEVPARL